jgi:hypothetical protein
MMTDNALENRQRGFIRIPNTDAANAAAIFDLLDASKGPVKVKVIQKELHLTPQQYRSARRELTYGRDDVYITQEGLVLSKYVKSTGARFWHLAWCLGLLEVSGEQLVMDEDMLKAAPAAFVKLFNSNKLPADATRLRLLQSKAKERITTLLKLADMYRNIDRVLGLALLPDTISREWKSGMREIRNNLRRLN